MPQEKRPIPFGTGLFSWLSDRAQAEHNLPGEVEVAFTAEGWGMQGDLDNREFRYSS